MTEITTLAMYFEKELASILHLNIRQLITKLLDNAPVALKTRPSSATGVHHPPDERGPGGWILHAHRVAYLCVELARAFSLTTYQRDLMVGAALIHDIFQFGYSGMQEESDITHAETIADDVKDLEESYGHVARDLEEIVRLHMGQWSAYDTPADWEDEVYGKEGSSPAVLFHIADYVASRDNVIIDVGTAEKKEES